MGDEALEDVDPPAPFVEDDRVRVRIPDPTDVDHRHHGRTGTVTSVTRDDLGELLDDPRESFIVDVRFDDGGIAPFRPSDLAPIGRL